MKTAFVLGALLAGAFFAACGSSSSGGGGAAGDAGSDAPRFSDDAAPDAEPEPGPGDPCGNRSGLMESAPWPLRGGCPKRAGYGDFAGPRNATLKWSVPIPAGASSPVVDASRLVWVGTSDGDVVAVTQGGLVQSATRTGASVVASAAMNAQAAAVVGSTDGFLYGIFRGGVTPSDAGADADASAIPSGQVALKQALAPIVSSAVIVHDGTILVTTADALVALDATGNVRWQKPVPGAGPSSPALANDDTAYVGSSDGHLYAFGPAGDVKWTYDAGAPVVASPVIGGDDAIYVASSDGTLHAVEPSGTRRWTSPLGAAVSGVAAYAGTVYAASGKKVHALSTRTGKEKWAFETLGTAAPPVVDREGYVYFGSTDAKAYVLTPGGLLFFAVNTKGPITSAPALSDDATLYVTTDKALVAIGP